MCSSAIIILADLLEVFGIGAIIIGFFNSVTQSNMESKWGAEVFLLGVVAFVVGSRISGLC